MEINRSSRRMGRYNRYEASHERKAAISKPEALIPRIRRDMMSMGLVSFSMEVAVT
ncbi:hypothetical protein D3C71_2069510 [compost metagenome]